MKFLCANCNAKYQIPDEKVAGRTLRMTCRRCNEPIVVRSDASSVVAPAPSAAPPRAQRPLAADLRRQLSERPQAARAIATASEGWHVAIGETPVGPVSLDEVKHKLDAGSVNAGTLAWREGMGDWLAIRDIPELALLVRASHPPPLAGSAPPPHVVVPTSRPAPAITAPEPVAPALGDWGSGAADLRVSQFGVDPLTMSNASANKQTSPAVLFALAGFFAFLLTATMIAGMRFLKDDPPPAATAPPLSAPVPKTAKLEVPLGEDEGEPEEAPGDSEMVFELGDIELGSDDEEPSGETPKRATSKTTTGTKPAAPKKTLTAEQRAMLERMGGGDTGDIGGLKRPSTSAANTRSAGTTVDAAALSKVVAQGKRNLQRCYESAMRSSGVDDTVRLDVEISVSGSGNVTKVTTRGNGMPGLDACIQRTVRMWRFPASGEAFATKFPLLFAPGS